jgi:hypothetical protein
LLLPNIERFFFKLSLALIVVGHNYDIPLPSFHSLLDIFNRFFFLCFVQADRFIPVRTAMDLDVSNFSLSKENQSQVAHSAVSSPTAQQRYQERLANQMFDGKNPSDAKILAFKTKAPAPKEGHQAQHRVLYSSSMDASATRMPKPIRHISSTSERSLGKCCKNCLLSPSI